MVNTGLSCYRCGYNFRLLLMGPVVNCPQCDEVNHVRWAYYFSRITRAIICAVLLSIPLVAMAIALFFKYPSPLWPNLPPFGLTAFLLVVGILIYRQSWSVLLFQRVLKGFDALTETFTLLGGLLVFSFFIVSAIYSALTILNVSNKDIWLIIWVALTLGSLFSIRFENLWDDKIIRVTMKTVICLSLTSVLALILSIWLPGLDIYYHGLSILLVGALIAGIILMALTYGYWSEERLESARRIVLIALIAQGAISVFSEYLANIDRTNVWVTAGLAVFIAFIVGLVLVAIIKIKMDEKKPG